ncbi:MAG: rRNA adenine dimethyltransferase family protein [bacterium]
MLLLQETKLICKQHNIIPSRKRGQNFLINEDVYKKIIEIADLSKEDAALEVGPGLGILTRLLCKNSGRVVAIELDKKIFDYLAVVKEVERLDNLELLNKNILDFEKSPQPPFAKGGKFEKSPFRQLADPFTKGGKFENPPSPPLRKGGLIKSPQPPLPGGSIKIVANLPYNITSIFLRKFLHFLAEGKISEMVLMLQKEVAERIASKPGQMSLLSVSAQFYSEPEIVDYVNKNNFWPQPKVDSAIIKLKPIGDLAEKKSRSEVDEKVFFQIARIGFSAKRKKLVNNLANGLHKKQAGILPFLLKIGANSNTRAQELSVAQWISLANFIKN